MGGVEVALDPSELVDMDDETLKEKYEHGLQAAKPESHKEDMSDLLQEHLTKEAKKRKQTQEKKSSSKDNKSFKF